MKQHPLIIAVVLSSGLMASPAFAELVVRNLQLHRDPKFMERSVPTGALTPAQEKDWVSRAADKLKSSTEVKRQSQTQLVEVTVSAPSASNPWQPCARWMPAPNFRQSFVAKKSPP